MILRRFFTLTALVVAASLSLSDRANAGYDFSTTIPAANIVGNVGAPQTGTGAFTLGSGSLNNGSVITPSSSQIPYTFFVDQGGSTVYLVNSSGTNVPYGVNTAVANVNVYVASPQTSTDHSTWSFTDTITITNPSGATGPGTTGTFQETSQYTMNVSPGSGTLGSSGTAQVTLAASYVGPTSMNINGTPFSLNTPLSTQFNVNNATNGTVGTNITSVPEPASVVMLGAGLVGVVGLGLAAGRDRNDYSTTYLTSPAATAARRQVGSIENP